MIEREWGGNGSEITTRVIALCRSLKRECVVEGIETAGQVEILRRLDCHFMQGYYFAKPMGAEALRGFIAEAAREGRFAA